MHAIHWVGATLAYSLQVTPDPSKLPGSTALQNLVDGIAGFVIALLAIALMAGAAAWALGHHSGNYRASEAGKMAIITSLVGSFVVGGAAALVNWFVSAGGGI
jgi:Family of unknown function (DUF6112)/TrbC/VIRB2 pilin